MAWREPPNTVQVSIKRLSASGRRKRLAGEGQVLGMVHLRARNSQTKGITSILGAAGRLSPPLPIPIRPFAAFHRMRVPNLEKTAPWFLTCGDIFCGRGTRDGNVGDAPKHRESN